MRQSSIGKPLCFQRPCPSKSSNSHATMYACVSVCVVLFNALACGAGALHTGEDGATDGASDFKQGCCDLGAMSGVWWLVDG